MKKFSIAKFIPVIFAFMTMAYVDLVGISVNYIKGDFGLSDTMTNAFGSLLFFWFLVVSVPTGMIMNALGRRTTVAISTAITCLAVAVPIINYSLPTMMISFALLGIGNTMLQVSINPLVADMVPSDKLATGITFGQFVKSIISFLIPIIVIAFAKNFENWRLIYPLFAVLALVPTFLLAFTKIEESAPAKNSGFVDCLALLKNPIVAIFFSGILIHVGIDVGINITAPKILIERAGFALEQAGYATSLYFFFRIATSFAGALILARMSAKIFFLISVVIMLVATSLLFFANNEYAIYTAIAMLGIGNANIFSIIFTKALQALPERKNEVSGLMVMGIAGGAVFPFFMGVASDISGSQLGAVAIILICIAYLLFVGAKLEPKKQ
jgi:fucose permease